MGLPTLQNFVIFEPTSLGESGMPEFRAAIISVQSTAEKPQLPGYEVTVRLEGKLGLVDLTFKSDTKNLDALKRDVESRLRQFGQELVAAFSEEGRVL